MALSKTWTAKDLIDLVRVNINEILPDDLQEYTLYKYTNLAINQISAELSDKMIPDYGTVVSLSIGDDGTAQTTASLTGLQIYRIQKVTDGQNKLIASKTIDEYNNLTSMDSWKRSTFVTYNGETLYFFTGSLVTTPLTASLHYYRLPIPITTGSQYIDIREQYVPVVVDKIKAWVSGQIDTNPPKEPDTTPGSMTVNEGG